MEITNLEVTIWKCEFGNVQLGNREFRYHKFGMALLGHRKKDRGERKREGEEGTRNRDFEILREVLRETEREYTQYNVGRVSNTLYATCMMYAD